MIDTVGILAPSYVIGEDVQPVESLANRTEMLQAFGMPDRPSLWGWEAYRRSRRSAVELARDSAMQTLADSGLQASDIDALIVCNGGGLNYFRQNAFLAELADAVGLRCDYVSWIGGAGCTSLCSATKTASALVRSGDHANILIVTVDKYEDDAVRFQRFGVFSDGACSFILRGRGAIDYALVGVASASSLASLRSGEQDLAEKCRLIQTVFQRAGAGVDFPYAGSVLSTSNVFLPIQQLEQSVFPVKGLQTYRKNTARYGHCSAADPVINLVDYREEAGERAASHAVLAWSAYGHFGVMLLERRQR